MPPEIGSEFPWDQAVLGAGDDGWLPARHELFATATGAMSALLRQLAPRGRLHIPTYYCMEVAEALSAHVPIAWYRDLPDGRGPRWETLRTEPGDVVLAQNLFGRGRGEPWNDWMRTYPGATVVEDHSHDPLGAWARASRAPYAVASLRKTLPVPDGGLVWSPQGRELPWPAGPESQGAQLKLAAMLLKAAWLAGRPVPRARFRELQQRGENLLSGGAGPASAVTAAVLPLLDAPGIRERSVGNSRALAVALPAGSAAWRVLGAGPFRLQLVCPGPATRDALLRHLAAHQIFAPVHWRQNRTAWWSHDEEAATLADRVLTVPVDHRCTPSDVRRIADVLLSFTGSAPVPDGGGEVAAGGD